MRRLHFRLAVLLAASAPLPACVAPLDDVETKRGAAVDVCATAPEGALCDDKNVCTIFDVCKAGVCKGSAAPNGTLCTDGNVCTANDSCRGGFCMGDAVPDTTACTDGDPCTVGDVCKTGACVPGAGMLACSDGIACTLDVCVPGLGCLFQPVGDCSVPKDGGPDATDAKADAAKDVGGDVSPDVMMSGGDAASDKADAPKDVSGDIMSVDATGVDVMTPLDAPKDGAREAAVDAAGDDALGVADGGSSDASEETDAEAASDAEPDAEVADGAADAEARDAPADHALPVVTLPELRATGGACNCEAAPSGGGSSWIPSWATLLGALGLAAATRRRRR